MYLTYIEVLESLESIGEKGKKDKKLYAKKNYNQIISYKNLDHFYNKYKGNIEIENCRTMADLLY
jgi:hypothetical protein